jgi:hypothetical protein
MPVRTIATLLLAWCGLNTSLVADGPPQAAWLQNGRKLSGALVGHSADDLRFVAEHDAFLPLRGIRELTFGGGPGVVHAGGPTHLLLFHGGERLLAEVASGSPDEIVLRGPAGLQVRVPRWVLSAIEQPSGELLELYEDFEDKATSFELRGWRRAVSVKTAQSGRGSLEIGVQPGGAQLELPAPVEAGHLVLAWFDAQADGGKEWWIEFKFRQADQMATFRVIPAAGAGKIDCQPFAGANFRTQMILRQRAWRDLTMLFDRDRTLVLVDQWLLAMGPAPPGALVGVHVASAGTAPAIQSAQRPVDPATVPPLGYVDDVRLSRAVDVLKAHGPVLPGRDLLWFANGEELPGKFLAMNARAVQAANPAGLSEQLAWSQLRGVRFAAGHGDSAPVIRGVIARIDLAPRLGCVTTADEKLIAAIQSASQQQIVLAHPWLGELILPNDRVQRIVPRYLGSYCLVDPVAHHLGNDLHDDFESALPEGVSLERVVEFSAIPKGRAYVSFELAEIEPMGGEAPHDAGSERLRRQLSMGRLVTIVSVNGKELPWLNRFVSARARASNPVSVRVPVPLDALRIGKNALRIELVPSGDEPPEYDDLQFSRLALEFEE